MQNVLKMNDETPISEAKMAREAKNVPGNNACLERLQREVKISHFYISNPIHQCHEFRKLIIQLNLLFSGSELLEFISKQSHRPQQLNGNSYA